MAFGSIYLKQMACVNMNNSLMRDVIQIARTGKGQNDISYPWTAEVADSVHDSRMFLLSWLKTISSTETLICTAGFT